MQLPTSIEPIFARRHGYYCAMLGRAVVAAGCLMSNLDLSIEVRVARERIGSSRCGPRQRLFEQQDISYDNPAVVAEVRSIVAEHIGFRVIAPSMLDL